MRRMVKRGDNRGISKITLFILILLIVLIFVAYFVIKNIVLKGSGERTIGKFTLDLELSGVQVIDNNSLNVVVKRNKGNGQFTGINFILDDGENTEIIRDNVSMQELESRSFVLHFVSVNVSDAKKLSIDAIFPSETEKMTGKNIKDEYIFGSTEAGSLNCKPYCPPDAQCGSNGCGGECAGGCTQKGYICSERKCIANLETKCSQIDIIVKKVSNISAIEGGTNFSVLLSRQGELEDNIEGVKLIFTDENISSSFVMDAVGNIVPFGTSNKYVPILESHLANPKKIRVLVYFVDESGMEELCQPSSWLDF